MGLTNLESLKAFMKVNRRNYDCYSENLKLLPGIQIITHNEMEKSNCQYVVVEIDPAITQVTRDQLVDLLSAENIMARRYFYPGCHRMEPYRSYFPNAGLLLPNTERLCRRVMVLPTGTAVGTEEITTICRTIRFILEKAGEVCERLNQPQPKLEVCA
jgi:dTDP-4-amino-4,6-dideoxygalactose transaminase